VKEFRGREKGRGRRRREKREESRKTHAIVDEGR